MNNSVLWQPDAGGGTYRNPVLYADCSDPDAIRVKNTYYLTASSFNYTPGLPILTSEDLVHWKLANYAVKRIPYPAYEKPRHGCGVWAPSLRFYEGWFTIYYGMPDEGIFMVRAKDPLGKWEAPRLVLEGKGLIDPCPFREEDGSLFVVHAYAKSRIGFKSFLGAFPLSEDGTRAAGEDRLIYDGTRTQPTIEGPKVYRRGEWTYIFAPAGGVAHGWQTVLRSRSLLGPYEERVVLRQGDTPINGPHQGALVDTPGGKDWFLHFQSLGAYGRVLHLQPVRWRSGWPVIGREKEGREWGEPVLFYQKPEFFESKAALSRESPPPKDKSPLGNNDDFSSPTLGLSWQWLGNARKSFYSLKARPGFLRLYSENPSGETPAVLWNCSNVLTQKILGPSFTMETVMECGGLRKNERAGVLVIGGTCLWLGVEKKETLRVVCGRSGGSGEAVSESVLEEHALPPDTSTVFFRIRIVKRGEEAEAEFFYGLREADKKIAASFRLSADTWTGAKTGLFCVADDAKEHGGWADSRYVRYEPLPQ